MEKIDIIYLGLSLGFVLVCAFFSSAEIGFINLQKIKLKHLQEKGVRGADRVARIMEHPERFLSTVLTGISFAETIVVSLGTMFIVAMVGEKVGTPLSIVLIAIVLLIFAKVIPKTIAARHPARIAILYGGIIELITLLLYPVVLALGWITARVTRTSAVAGALISREEMSTVISLGLMEGVVDEHSARIMSSVVRLGERKVGEIMTPRPEAAWLEQGSTLSDFLKIYIEHPAARYPIYEKTYDNVKGQLSARDVLGAIARGSIPPEGSVGILARPVYFVPETKTVGELFGDMSSENYLMAVVVDEYGGSSGILSIDQLVDEIVGEVKEGLVGSEKPFEVVGARAYRIRGSMRIEDVNRELKFGLPEGEFKTIGGFAFELFGHLPKVGEQVLYNNLRLLAAEVKENKITQLFVTKEKIEEEEEAAPGKSAKKNKKEAEKKKKEKEKNREKEKGKEGKK